MLYKDLYKWGSLELEQVHIPEAMLDARLLLEYVCHTTLSDLHVQGDMVVGEADEATYRKMIEKRKSRIPVQHITGEQEFMGLNFKVNDQVLVPRQDTEILVEEVMKNLHDGMHILDMCTGSGCILLSLLHYSNDCQGTGTDISEAALAVAKKNAEALSLEANWIQSDLFEKIDGKYDIIVSNPPYIASAVIPTLEPEVRDHEPMMALDGKEDGLYFYQRIVKECKKNLYHGGMLFFEIGYDQGNALVTLMSENGFKEVEVVKDYAGLDRVVFGTLAV
ncbi:MAG: peptide chain release factor N(5)-glutamine methyltransferase [Lachnospiraceae bacterium]|nr:peptide chain release factor N(5)-glutamine methyltransferase [Lachnospiraceae bacterium]